MRVYYNARGRRRGYSLSGGEAYVHDWLQVCGMVIVAAVVLMAVLAAAALILAFFVIVGLLWCVGWTMARLHVGGDKGPRLKASMANVFQSSKKSPGRISGRAAHSPASAPKYNVVCPKCSKAVMLPAGQGVKCPSCRTKINVTPKPPPGPRDPWLNEIAVALADDLDLTEFARNTGTRLGGAPLLSDVGVQADKFAVYINLFANDTLARQAEIGLRASPQIRDAVSKGFTILRLDGCLLYAANGRGGVVDEFRLDEVVRVVRKIPLPSTIDTSEHPSPRDSANLTQDSRRSQAPTPSPVTSTPLGQGRNTEFPQRITQRWIANNVPDMSPREFSALVAELRRRGWPDTNIQRRVARYLPSQSLAFDAQTPALSQHRVPFVTAGDLTTSTSRSPGHANGVLYFSGNGSKNLGTIVVATESTVAWTNDGGFFAIRDDERAFGITSQGHADTSVIDAGTYHHVSVQAAGNWTLAIAPP